jgi:uncharacterized protein YkwD
MKSTMFFLPLIFALITSCTKDASPGIDTNSTGSTIDKTLLLQLVNDARKKGCNCGNTYYAPVPALSWNEKLEKAAYSHSNDMYGHKFLSHTGTNGSGSGERITSAGYNWRYYGENIAQGYKNEKEVVAGWLSSPGHCANIMNKNFKEMGAAKVGDYWTQDFGSPLSQ